MNVFKSVLKLGVDIAFIPVSIVLDIVTFGGVNTDRDEPYLVDQINRISKDAKKIDKWLGHDEWWTITFTMLL